MNMKKLFSLLITLSLIAFVAMPALAAKPEKNNNNGQGGPNGTFVRFDNLDSYWKTTESGLIHEWRTTDNRHLVFKPVDKFMAAECEEGYINSFLWTAHTSYDQSYPFDEADLKDFITSGTQYWVCIYEWNSNKVNLYPELVQSLKINAKDADGENSLVLDKGKEYIFIASGTADAGNTIEFDADYSITKKVSGHTWTDEVTNYETYGDKLLSLLVDGELYNWGEFNENHIYQTKYLGEGGIVNFRIHDIYYSNNNGTLTVDIYKMP